MGHLRDEGFCPCGHTFLTRAHGEPERLCQAEFSLPLQWIAPRTEELWRLEYDYYVNFYLPCMKEWGIDLYRDDIPSEDVWVAQAMEEQDDLWLP